MKNKINITQDKSLLLKDGQILDIQWKNVYKGYSYS